MGNEVYYSTSIFMIACLNKGNRYDSFMTYFLIVFALVPRSLENCMCDYLVVYVRVIITRLVHIASIATPRILIPKDVLGENFNNAF